MNMAHFYVLLGSPKRKAYCVVIVFTAFSCVTRLQACTDSQLHSPEQNVTCSTLIWCWISLRFAVSPGCWMRITSTRWRLCSSSDTRSTMFSKNTSLVIRRRNVVTEVRNARKLERNASPPYIASQAVVFRALIFHLLTKGQAWLPRMSNKGKGMFLSGEQAFVGRGGEVRLP